MYIDEKLNLLIDKAISIAGSQRKLAAMLDMEQANFAKIKKGERPANWRVRGKLRAILGEDPTHAFMAAMAEDLEESEREDEKKAADGFKAMLAAFPQDWRRRMISDLHLTALDVVRWLRGTVHSTLNCRQRNAVLGSKTLIRSFAAQILGHSRRLVIA